MKKKQIITLFLLLFGTVISAQTKKEIIKSMIEEVTYLASDELEGRATGTDSEKLAADFIGQKFLEYNLQEKGDKDYLQFFTATIKDNPHSQQIKRKIEGINVVGFKDNNKEETIIIGGHYDHLGYGDFGSLYVGERAIHKCR